MQILIELDDELLRRLEKVAPGKSRRRSAFVRDAIQQALWALEEERTRRAHLEAPDAEAAPFDPGNWEPLPYGGFDPPATLESRARPPARGKRRAPSKPAKPAGKQAGRARKAGG
ncbi:MAG: hypothetical protein IT377_10685 [Polyangiaceae bacterium]|nr:hypothetical protein [Polyangiaceae bacterium]